MQTKANHSKRSSNTKERTHDIWKSNDARKQCKHTHSHTHMRNTCQRPLSHVVLLLFLDLAFLPRKTITINTRRKIKQMPYLYVRQLPAAHREVRSAIASANSRPLQRLRWLNVSGSRCITDDGIRLLVSTFSQLLHHLNIASCCRISDNAVAHIAACLHSLASLDLSYNQNLTNQSLQHVALMASLIHIRLEGCTLLCDSGLAYLAESHGNLQSVSLGWYRGATEDGIRNLALPTEEKRKMIVCKRLLASVPQPRDAESPLFSAVDGRRLDLIRLLVELGGHDAVLHRRHWRQGRGDSVVSRPWCGCGCLHEQRRDRLLHRRILRKHWHGQSSSGARSQRECPQVRRQDAIL